MPISYRALWGAAFIRVQGAAGTRPGSAHRPPAAVIHGMPGARAADLQATAPTSRWWRDAGAGNPAVWHRTLGRGVGPRRMREWTGGIGWGEDVRGGGSAVPAARACARPALHRASRPSHPSSPAIACRPGSARDQRSNPRSSCPRIHNII
jgi:hypothetical protein